MKIDPQALAGVARLAGAAIMEVYRGDFAVEEKEDHSPLTKADLASQEIISQALSGMYPEIPMISEEAAKTEYLARRKWKRFWLIDPLDGTKEFVARNGEFTVNIGLVEGARPVFGVIYVPNLDLVYYGGQGIGAFKLEGGASVALRTQKPGPDGPTVAALSRSHPDPRLEEYLAAQPGLTRVIAGSAYKFCLLAEGKVNLYARFNPTWEWDTAAGQAIVEAAGGSFCGLDGGAFLYNKENLKNPGFVAKA